MRDIRRSLAGRAALWRISGMSEGERSPSRRAADALQPRLAGVFRQLGMKDVNTCPAPLSSLDACAGGYCVTRPFTRSKSICLARRLNI